jgi:hypothetical protein
MKNLFLLPTYKPSRLFKVSDELKLTRKFHFYNGSEYQHIYITSDEEIKEDDWGLSKLNEVILFGRSYNEKFYKKIILTTDADLIKDGVQEIDDDFLQWFIKNPTCEFIDIKRKQHFETDKSKRVNPLNGIYYSFNIVIPKEEPKPILGVDYEYSIDDEGMCIEIPIVKQQTVEEIVEKMFPFTDDDSENRIITIKRLYWIDGAKWQAERMFSEEYMYEFAKFCSDKHTLDDSDEQNIKWNPLFRGGEILSMQEMFEQFKKK